MGIGDACTALEEDRVTRHVTKKTRLRNRDTCEPGIVAVTRDISIKFHDHIWIVL